MTIKELTDWVINKAHFTTIDGFIEFCEAYLEYVDAGKLQAVIVSQNENHYRFWQYGKDAGFQITRPINSKLIYSGDEFDVAKRNFLEVLPELRTTGGTISPDMREAMNRTVYTVQQSIGAALDALPAGESNKARKLNGTLFENFVRLILNAMQVDAQAGTVRVPVVLDGAEQFRMNYQHDLIVKYEGDVRAIGSIKTSSKDRIDKIFIDKFLYSRLTNSNLPHIAIFLNDVQRKNTRTPGRYGISATFLPGHFKGYTIKLNPLDGVYYCDIRPNMTTEPILKDHIRTLDHLLCTDLWKFLQQKDDLHIEADTIGPVDLD